MDRIDRLSKIAQDEFGITIKLKSPTGETFESLYGETKNSEKRVREIEEIAKAMCGGCTDSKECRHCLCADWYKAEDLYNAGYRRQIEVAKEIGRDIIESVWEAYKNSTSEETVLLVVLICEGINTQLKKKYTEEPVND